MPRRSDAGIGTLTADPGPCPPPRSGEGPPINPNQALARLCRPGGSQAHWRSSGSTSRLNRRMLRSA